jgi:hypothetical protein
VSQSLSAELKQTVVFNFWLRIIGLAD